MLLIIPYSPIKFGKIQLSLVFQNRNNNQSKIQQCMCIQFQGFETLMLWQFSSFPKWCWKNNCEIEKDWRFFRSIWEVFYICNNLAQKYHKRVHKRKYFSFLNAHENQEKEWFNVHHVFSWQFILLSRFQDVKKDLA